MNRFIVNFDTKNMEKYFYDYIIVGSGIAGLYSAYLAKDKGKTCIITKKTLTDSNTFYAQGGIACSISKEDSWESHYEDTIKAGDGLADCERVEILTKCAVDRIRDLIKIGVEFDKNNGSFSLGREGAHSKNRILHKGDRTGAEIELKLAGAVKNYVDVYENHFAIDLLVKDGECYGVLVKYGKNLKAFYGKVVILATGGLGRLYRNTSNPEIATGDGMAMAYRSGAILSDMEFVQFHPTVFYTERGERFLISEAVRGEGALLKNLNGERFMPKYHPLLELAPRDIVSRAIFNEMISTKNPFVYLDATAFPKGYFEKRFPQIYENLKKEGINPESDFIPVSPAVHYVMGGIVIDDHGRTNIDGLFAVGECSCSFVHGANRLASNSLLEALVFSKRCIDITEDLLSRPMDCPHFYWNGNIKAENIDAEKFERELRDIMEYKVGLVRNEDKLLEALRWFDKNQDVILINAFDEHLLELKNMMTVGKTIVLSALERTESRGSHFREDFPQKDYRWEKHIFRSFRG